MYTGLPVWLQVLVSACPCAVVAAAPVVQSCAFVRLLSDLQVLVKDQLLLNQLFSAAVHTKTNEDIMS